MKLKLRKVTIDGKEVEVAEVQDGKPVYLDDEGKEQLGDLPALIQNLKRTADERDGAKGKLTEAEAKLRGYEVDGKPLDPKAAAEALKKIQGLDDKKLIDAGEAVKLREQVVAELQRQHAEEQSKLKAENEKLKADAFTQARRFALTEAGGLKNKEGKPVYRASASTLDSLFGHHFGTDKQGNLVAFHDIEKKQQVLSKKPERAGQPADPTEALEILVGKHPDKDLLLAGVGATGSGQPGGGGGGGNGKIMPRSQFEGLPPQDQIKFSKDGGTLTDG